MKAIIAVVAFLGAFVAGVAGVYFAMPTFAPEKVERAKAHLDSLALVDSLALAFSRGMVPDSTAMPPGIGAMPATPPDSLGAAAPPAAAALPGAETASAIDPGSEAAPPADTARDTAVQDSLRLFQQRFEGLERDQQQLIEQIEALKQQLKDQQSHGTDVQELSATLSKLEDKDLAEVVEKLDMDVLRTLYLQASARNRTRLLKAMPSHAAAGFVRQLVHPNKAAEAPATALPDTTDALLTTSSDLEPLNR